VSPGLTHRSFLADAALRATERLPRWRRGTGGRLPLHGVLDELPGAVTVMPTVDQQERARAALAGRLVSEGRPSSSGAVAAVYARGDGHDTPLGLPESLAFLTGWLDALR
jgi:hypothetical protein